MGELLVLLVLGAVFLEGVFVSATMETDQLLDTLLKPAVLIGGACFVLALLLGWASFWRKRRCGALTRAGHPCRNGVRGTWGRCIYHRGSERLAPRAPTAGEAASLWWTIRGARTSMAALALGTLIGAAQLLVDWLAFRAG
ncbi:MAG: hypothetical protein GEV08_05450 [Acidimicrobiia bacterium]|nr:hypothetical protein [Acidimicrobiia bacterium]